MAISDDTSSLILAAVRHLEAGQDSLRTEVSNLHVGVMERLDRHEDHLGSIRDDIAVSMGRADQAGLVSLNTRDETRLLSQQIAIQQRQISKLVARVDALTPKA